VSNAGKYKQLTGANGCVAVHVRTASLPPTSGTTGPSITFSAGPTNVDSTGGGSQATVTVPFVVNAAQLQTTSCPAATTPGVYTVTLKLLDGVGNALPGQTITGTCTATPGTGALSVGPILPTNATGETSVTVTATPTTASGQCIFQPTNFQSIVASVTISGTGTDSCSGGFSPQP
jgi:hypothetical protein